ncbi:hypothetical protein F5879DRAFT_810566, partial [Lentinula edodes]
MPLLAGDEARSKRVRKVKPTADTGHPETSKKFAARMRNRVRILGPRKRDQEGGKRLTIKLPARPTVPAKHGERVQEGPIGPTETHVDESELPVTPGSSIPNPTSPDFDNATLLNILGKSDTGLDLPSALKNRYSEDPLFRKILDSPKDFHNFEVLHNLIYLKRNEHKVLCIPRVLINGHSAQELIISEAHSILAHLGASKTVDYLRDHVWWK